MLEQSPRRPLLRPTSRNGCKQRDYAVVGAGAAWHPSIQNRVMKLSQAFQLIPQASSQPKLYSAVHRGLARSRKLGSNALGIKANQSWDHDGVATRNIAARPGTCSGAPAPFEEPLLVASKRPRLGQCFMTMRVPPPFGLIKIMAQPMVGKHPVIAIEIRVLWALHQPSLHALPDRNVAPTLAPGVAPSDSGGCTSSCATGAGAPAGNHGPVHGKRSTSSMRCCGCSTN